MQLLARLMDHVLSARTETADRHRRHLGRHRRAAVEAFRGRRVDLIVLFPDGPRLGRAAAHDDDAGRGERSRGRRARHLRRLPGAREGAVQRPRFPRPRATRRRQLDQLGAHRGADDVLLRRRRRARCARIGRSPSACPPGISATSSPATWRAAWGSRRPAGHRHERQRHPAARAGRRRLRDARGGGHLLALHGHPGLLQLRALPVRGLGPGSPRRARQMGPLANPAASRSERRGSLRPNFDAAAAGEAETADCIRRVRRGRLPRRPAHGLRRRRSRNLSRRERAHPEIVLATAHPAKFPDAIEDGEPGRRCRHGLPP